MYEIRTTSVATMDDPRIILVKEVSSQVSGQTTNDERADGVSSTEDKSPVASANAYNVARQKKSVRFLDVDENMMHHRGSIHEELCQLDKLKPLSTGQINSRTISLADRPPPVFSISSITDAGPSPLFPAAVNPKSTANSQREIDESIDRLLEGSDVDAAAVCPKGSEERLKERRLTVFQHQLLEFRHSETAKTELKLRLQRLSTFLCAASILAIALAIADLEYSYGIKATSGNITNASDPSPTLTRSPAVGICLKIGITLVSILTCALLYSYFHQHCRFLIIKHYLPIGATVLTSMDRWSFLAEFALCIFHVPPLTDQFVPIELQLVCFLRLYLVGRYMREHSHMAFNKSTRFLASVLHTELGAGFLVKTFFIKWPFRMVGICYCLNLFGVGYLVFSIDRLFSSSHFNPLQDVIWMQVVTMTTLGFGDVVPESIVARAFVGMSSVFGIFLMALLISVTHETLQMSQQEKRILAYVERQEFEDRVKHRAARCVQATWRLYWFKRSGHDSSPGRLRRALQPMMPYGKTKERLIKKLYVVLSLWREIRKRKSQDDGWSKDFVADNTAIMLTDVARRLEKMDTILKRSLGIEDDDTVDGKQRVDQQEYLQQVSPALAQPSMVEAPPLDRKKPADDGISMETVLHHLADLGGSLEETHHRTMTEFQALQSLMMARREGAVRTPDAEPYIRLCPDDITGQL